MSGDEVFAFVVSLGFTIWGWKRWVAGLLFLNSLSRRAPTQALGWLLPPLAGLVVLFVLCNLAAHDVRDDPVYIAFYMVMWLGWTGLCFLLLPYLGLNFRDDALERDNTAAGLAIGGVLLGITFIFAGGNIGEGPGWWVVVFCAALASATLLVMWVIGNQFTGVCEAITIDRDVAAGWRTAGFFIASGLILGRAVAGDWHSESQTVSDFIGRGWPAALLWVVALVLDRLARPTPQRPAPDHLILGTLPAFVFVVAGFCDLLTQGRW